MEQKVVVINGENTVEEQLIRWCLGYVYAQCVNDNDMLDMVCKLSGLTEVELMYGFEGISQDMGFDLDKEADGMWEKE